MSSMDVILGRVGYNFYSKEPHLPLSLRSSVRDTVVSRAAIFLSDDALMAMAESPSGIIPAIWSAKQGSQSPCGRCDGNYLQRLQVLLEEVPS